MSVDLHSARAAVRRSAAERKALRGRDPTDRDERLRACLSDLSDAMEPINAALRRGPVVGRSQRNREARKASETLQAERSKVRGMLRRASGGPKARRAPYRRVQFRGSLRQIVRATNEVERELDKSLPQMPKGSRDYRDEAQRILDAIDRLQRRLTQRRAQARYWADPQGPRAWGRLTPRDREDAATAVETAAALRKLRQGAKRAVAVPLRPPIGTFQPQRPSRPPARRRRWEADEAYQALLDWTARNGRTPKATDLPNDPTLPSYATVHNLLGGLTDDLTDDLTLDAARLS